MNEKKKIYDERKLIIDKKIIMVLTALFVLGIFTGGIVGNYFFIDANQKIDEWNQGIDAWYDAWGNYSWENYTDGNYSNNNMSENYDDFYGNDANWSGFYEYLTPLTYNDVILPIISVILLCISSYLLLGLNITYARIFLNTKSKYVLGLVFVLFPLLVVFLFFLRISKSLFVSSAFKYSMIDSFLGFGVNGIGSMLSILSVFMIIGLSILFYLSNQ